MTFFLFSNDISLCCFGHLQQLGGKLGLDEFLYVIWQKFGKFAQEFDRSFRGQTVRSIGEDYSSV
jgi:hypothetical protein